MGSGASKQPHSGDRKRGSGRNMSGKGSDQHLRELLLEKTGEIQRLKTELERWEPHSIYTHCVSYTLCSRVRDVAGPMLSVYMYRY